MVIGFQLLAGFRDLVSVCVSPHEEGRYITVYGAYVLSCLVVHSPLCFNDVAALVLLQVPLGYFLCRSWAWYG